MCKETLMIMDGLWKSQRSPCFIFGIYGFPLLVTHSVVSEGGRCAERRELGLHLLMLSLSLLAKVPAWQPHGKYSGELSQKSVQEGLAHLPVGFGIQNCSCSSLLPHSPFSHSWRTSTSYLKEFFILKKIERREQDFLSAVRLYPSTLDLG